MGNRFFSSRNIKFLLYEVFDVTSLTRNEYYQGYNKKSLDMVLQAATELAQGLLFPLHREMDENPPELGEKGVLVHPAMRKIMMEFGNGGWISATTPDTLEGQQIPHLIADSSQFIFAAANYSAFAYAILSVGAAHLLEAFALKEIQEIYLPQILSGRWQGTMALTEPEAGSSLGDITTTASPTNMGYYRIRGQKIFISAGDHDAAENVVHMLLARIEGASPGVKGVSLFVVPKKRLDKSGQLISNDVVVSGIFHKLGYRGCPTTQLSFGDSDDCHGYLVGEPHQGLNYMFQMMNEERIAVGLGATAMATAAYYEALEYAKQRRQGRRVRDSDPSNPPVPIIEHADVKRMLLFQRSVTEGALSLLLQCSKYIDMQKICSGQEKDKYGLLLEILTPVAKTYPSEMGILAVSQALQIFGGSGYCSDYSIEQYYRDVRIHPIHEGTTGIHGIDLLGRKVIMNGGRAFSLYVEEIEDVISTARDIPLLSSFCQKLGEGLGHLRETTQYLIALLRQQNRELFLADATLYLEFFGIITIAWQWLLQGITIHKGLKNSSDEKDLAFYRGKLIAFQYFYEYELPKISGLKERLMNSDGLTVEANADLFFD